MMMITSKFKKKDDGIKAINDIYRFLYCDKLDSHFFLVSFCLSKIC